MSERHFGDGIVTGGLYPDEIARFREKVQPGDRLTCYTGRPTEKKSEGEVMEESRCTIIKKYPYIALTRSGLTETCYQWSMLALWNRHLAK